MHFSNQGETYVKNYLSGLCSALLLAACTAAQVADDSHLLSSQEICLLGGGSTQQITLKATKDYKNDNDQYTALTLGSVAQIKIPSEILVTSGGAGKGTAYLSTSQFFDS